MSMFSRWRIAAHLVVASMLVQPVLDLSAASSAAGGNVYEIPLSELKKVEKKKPKKAETRKHAEKRRAHTAPRKVSEPSGTSAPSIPAPPVAQNAATALETADSANISHEPYSYVVPGKRTTVKAVVSLDAVQSVRCRFRAGDKGGDAWVPMAKVPGSQFTYGASLPALESGATALRYRVVVVDAAGNEIHSKEFVTPVKATPVVPGWQQDSSREPIRAVLGNPRQPLEGFSGVVIENADRQ
ncbi:hypothetical protein F6V30_01090 [Oryzomonas sagensis]|uniref:Uncharacterized protein n=1 Tax=Oryzomonas sagensis TaxID=2603857 RepID=A0ABQ6TQA2_9BACT|nr:hypothetical protein [Oryzomonas sagensis]KAB0671216.1 hypothetical protein F6V30_01090 [Oryzomonas sagensis]